MINSGKKQIFLINTKAKKPSFFSVTVNFYFFLFKYITIIKHTFGCVQSRIGIFVMRLIIFYCNKKTNYHVHQIKISE